MILLSVVIITFNEEKHIGRCLDSVQGLADDIVVLDSFSTDHTVEICREKRARVVQHRFLGHIAQKNLAITHAQHPHILSLDADEYLSPELRESIVAVKANWNCDGYLMNRLNHYCGRWIRHGSWYPDRKLRLWDRRKGNWGGVDPHDHFILQEGCRAVQLKGDLLHEAYENIGAHLEKIRHYTAAAAIAMHRKEKKSSGFKMVLSPQVSFCKSYLLRLGFLDGWRGFAIATLISYGTFIKYLLLWELDHPVRRVPPK